MTKKLQLLALSGSLRENSYNTAAIKALRALAPASVILTIGSIESLPLFNPDREDEEIAAVVDLNATVKNAEGLIIASPEYAHGVSGPLKNALDWLVGGDGFPYKPIMLINTSPRAHHAQDALRETLLTMSGEICEASCVAIPLLSSNLDVAGILADKRISATLSDALDRFCEYIVLKQSATLQTDEENVD